MLSKQKVLFVGGYIRQHNGLLFQYNKILDKLTISEKAKIQKDYFEACQSRKCNVEETYEQRKMLFVA